MAGLPEITMAGTLVAEPEMRFTPAGAGVCSFTLAANDRRLNKQTGEWEDAGATFLRCTVWRRQGENIADHCHKGDRLLITGELRQSEWNDKTTGEKRYGFDVQVTEAAVSTKFHPAKAIRAERSTAQGGGNGAGPWETAPAAPAGGGAGFSDEPPF
ncbi:single-stranded DNA-binding protein [Amycolatopsis coloradensis]|uniref:Single-stranded DNA-binding protein n=1 Tax=Amycolatopsis coloradensis TaxID=76021 RepID=A0ACD5BDI2_9PSEU